MDKITKEFERKHLSLSLMENMLAFFLKDRHKSDSSNGQRDEEVLTLRENSWNWMCLSTFLALKESIRLKVQNCRAVLCGR
jgi:hypothetical protein